MFFKKKFHTSLKNDTPTDIWGRDPLELYEKIGRPIPCSSKSLLRTDDGKFIKDYMVLFYNGKPDIRGMGVLLYAGEWINYSTKIYRVNTLLSSVELSDLIIEELNITLSDFLVSETRVGPLTQIFY
ncbi:hypothetical protein ABE945_17250 [Enterococcus gilvus]|uniref:hypothetical protein n=1 Tax=Enterococcus gilvus TaxID=160453 RepID=UPI003D6BF2EA